MTWAAVFAICMAFFGKFNALLQSIPMPVMGGIMVLLFGTIASIGLKTLIEAKVDLMQPRNLVIISVVLTAGIGGLTLKLGGLELAGVGLCSILAMALNLILPKSSDGITMALSKAGHLTPDPGCKRKSAASALFLYIIRYVAILPLHVRMMNDSLPGRLDNVDTLLKFLQGLPCISRPLPSGADSKLLCCVIENAICDGVIFVLRLTAPCMGRAQSGHFQYIFITPARKA
jgi:hypothetical protein